MPSRKKAQGKARKAAKAAEATRKEDDINRRLEACDAQLQRLRIEDDECCKHGCDEIYMVEGFENETRIHGHETEKMCGEFVKDFLKVVYQVPMEQNPFMRAYDVTGENYSLVYAHPDNVILIGSLFLALATNCVLSGDMNLARHCASCATFFHCFKTATTGRPIAGIQMGIDKIKELFVADEHTLVRYIQKHIPCSCLDAKYKEVKGVKKIGLCSNPQCKIPDHLAERSTMLCCTRCRRVNYCSAECQEVNWPWHKEFCEAMRREKKAYKSDPHKHEYLHRILHGPVNGDE